MIPFLQRDCIEAPRFGAFEPTDNERRKRNDFDKCDSEWSTFIFRVEYACYCMAYKLYIVVGRRWNVRHSITYNMRCTLYVTVIRAVYGLQCMTQYSVHNITYSIRSDIAYIVRYCTSYDKYLSGDIPWVLRWIIIFNILCATYRVHCTVYIVYSVQCTVYYIQCIVDSLQCILHSVYYVVYII